MFEVATAGKLVSSKDSSFTNFKGFAENLFGVSSGAEKSAKSDKSAKSTKLTEQKDSLQIDENSEKQEFIIKSASGCEQKVVLDSNWQQAFENVWFLGDKAMLSINVVPLPENEKSNFLDTLKRKMLLGTENSYILWKNLELKNSPKAFEVSTYYCQFSTENSASSKTSSGENANFSLTKDKKLFTKLNNSEYGFFALTVFDSDYRKNHAYFDEVVKSYKIEK